jgi:RNA polymerase sigma factor (sigma-70 family)
MEAARFAVLIERFGAQMLATARRWSASDEDAEDAYQRAAERALLHRPTGSENELRVWLRTAVRYEALAIARQRRRCYPGGAPEDVAESVGAVSSRTGADVHTHAEQLERLRQGSQALRRLKPQEIRALQLQAEGHSYKEIGEITGWSRTKVNRCVNEGRGAFNQALRGIETGAECERLAPDLAALARGETAPSPPDLRAHLATCLACRARLRRERASADARRGAA